MSVSPMPVSPIALSRPSVHTAYTAWCAGRERVVVTDEGAACEEPVVGIPVLRADLGAGEVRPVVVRHRLPRVDPYVGVVLPTIEPDHVEAPGLVRCGPREELVVDGRLAVRPGREEPRVCPVHPTVARGLVGDVGLRGRPVDVVLVDVQQVAGPRAVGQRSRVRRAEVRRRNGVGTGAVVEVRVLPGLVDLHRVERNVCPPSVERWKSRCGSRESLQFSETNPMSSVPSFSTTGWLNWLAEAPVPSPPGSSG